MPRTKKRLSSEWKDTDAAAQDLGISERMLLALRDHIMKAGKLLR
jgi:hypothetical protein